MFPITVDGNLSRSVRGILERVVGHRPRATAERIETTDPVSVKPAPMTVEQVEDLLGLACVWG